MPRLAASVYAAHQDSVLKLAAKKGAVSRSQVAEALNISLPTAASIIERAGLELSHKEGRSEYYKIPGSEGKAAETPAAAKPADEGDEAEETTTQEPVKAKPAKAAEPAEDEKPSGVETDPVLSEVARLDEEIVDTRNALREAAAKVGQAIGEWATHQAVVDTLRDRLSKLATQRMSVCS